MVADELECGEFVRAGGLFDRAAQRGELLFNLVARQQMQSRGEDRRFQHCVLCSVEAEEISQAADVDDSRTDLGAGLRRIE